MKKLLALAITSAVPAFAAEKRRVIVCYRNRNHSCRNFPMTRLAIFCLLLFLAPATVLAQETDPIREALTRVIQDHRAVTAHAKALVTGEIDARIKATSATGNLDAVLKLIADKKAYEASGTLPAWLATVPALKSLPKSLMEVDARLKAAYKNAEIAYTKALELDKADAVRDELKNLPEVATPAPNVDPGNQADLVPAAAPAPTFKVGSFGTPVTFFWSCADDADIYVNGKPLRDYQPDFRSRGDEAPQTFSAKGVLRSGDVITVGCRRGGSYGFLMVAVDDRGKVVWRTAVADWKGYFPPERAKGRWYLPEVARQSRGAAAMKAPGYPPQRAISERFGNVAESIWHFPDAGARTCHLFSIVR